MTEMRAAAARALVRKGEDAANFEGHDDGFEAVQNGLVAEE